MKIYYAHCMAIYGTLQEKRDIATLEALGFEVVNPSDKKYAKAWKKHGMALAEDFAQDCDGVAFRSIPGGRIPAGVGTELELFKAWGKPVIELPSMVPGRVLSVDATQLYLSEVGQR